MISHTNVAKTIILIILILSVVLSFQNNLFGAKTSVTHFTSPSANSLEDYYKKSQELSGQTEQKTAVSFLAVGDIMLSRNVAATVQKSGQNNLPFSKMDNVFKSVDFVFGNLETPVAEKNGTVGGHSLIFNSPKELVKELASANFKILNLANNHALDQGLSGLVFTIKFLDELQIQHVGAGQELEQAWKPSIIEENGLKICFVGASYASINDNGKTTNNYVARIEDLSNLKSSILNVKSQCDFIVATMHAGTEYVRKPNQSQINFAHAAIDFGADIVIGAHPHWIQTIEKYNDKYIFYSLGNFIFDQEFSQDTKEGLTIKITVSKANCHPKRSEGSLFGGKPNAGCTDSLQGQKIPAKLEKIELLPVIIENYSTPRLANEEETKKILQKIGQPEGVLK